ncbi:MAG: transglycosylase SLT domain-containing protein [Luminiphilus sp.]
MTQPPADNPSRGSIRKQFSMRSLLADTLPKALLAGAMTLSIVLIGCGGESVAEVPEASTTASAPAEFTVSEPLTLPSDNILASADAATDQAETADAPASSSGTGSGGLKRFGVMPHFGDLDTMVERRAIRVLTVYGPGRYFLEDGPRGTVQEYADKLQKVVNEAFKTGLLTVQVAVIPVARDQLFTALQAGYGDIVMAGTTITDNRQAEVDFTNPVSKALKEVLITGPSAPRLGSLADLSGKTVYLRLSSSYAESVRELSQKLIEQGQAPIRIEAVDESLEDEDLIEMVDTGLLPWAVVDDYKPQMWREVFTRVTVRDDLVLREGARLAWAIRPDSPQLKAFLNTFLKDNREGTLFGNIIRNRYIRDFDWAENAVGAEELSRYRKLSALFRKYGTDYGMDPTLLAAQGFQESRLDQTVRSHVGAVGVMQLLPSTAEDKNVAIPNIDELEPNIEAGAKYMAFLKERYFSGPELDELNGSLLALASYNAGPGRIRRLRREAGERGYDPNLWFDNVEVIVAEQVGRETVQYVSNIFKYYLTYRWINTADAERAAARRATGIEDAP